MKFKEYYIIESLVEEESILLTEGKYLSMVKHFMTSLYKIRKKSQETEARNIHNQNNGKGRVWSVGNSINDLASESRSHISNLPNYYQPKLKRMVEMISGEPIDQFHDEVVERMFWNNNYKNYFKLYCVNFLLETLILYSQVNEVAFDKLMDDIDRIFTRADNLAENAETKEFVLGLMKLGPQVISVLGRFIKIVADAFEE